MTSPLKTSLSSLKYPRSYVAWDLETTGLDPKTDKILEIGAIKVVDGVITDTLHLMLNHGIDIPVEASNIHGITREECEKDGIAPDLAFEQFCKFFQWDTVQMIDVAPNLTHNGFKFDIPFLATELRRMGKHDYLAAIGNGCLDTAVMFKASRMGAQRHWHESFLDYADRVMEYRIPGLKYNVKFCCGELGISTEGFVAHRALADVGMTHQIYEKLIDALETEDKPQA